MFSDLGYTVKLANAKKTHDIAANKKTDKVDARTLADLLRTQYLPEVWIPTDEIIELREITRHKSRLTRTRVQLQNKIKSTLLMKGISYKKNIWNESCLEQLKKYGKQGWEQPYETRWNVDLYLDLDAIRHGVRSL